MKPRPYQTELIQQVGTASALNSSDVGTGKTPTTLWMLLADGVPERVLIVAPQATFYGWERTVRALADRPLLRVSTQAAGKRVYERLTAGGDGWYFIPWSTLTAWNKKPGRKGSKSVPQPLNDTGWDVVVFDEVHRAARHTTLNFQVASRIKRERTLCLSATPAGNDPVNIFGALHLTWPVEYPYFRRFAEANFLSEPNWFSDDPHSRIWGEERVPGRVRAEAPCWVGVRAAEVLPDMPAVVEEVRHVGMTRVQRALYRDWEDRALAWLNDQPVAAELPVVKYTRLRQALLGALEYDAVTDTVKYGESCRSLKIDALLEILEDLPRDEKVLVWCHSQKFMKPLVSQLRKKKYSCIEVSGKSSDDFRDFISGDVKILCAVPEALGEGTDGLQTVCSTEVWLSDTNNAILSEQAKGRLVRSGQKRSVLRYRIIVPDTVDEGVLQRLGERKAQLTRSEFM